MIPLIDTSGKPISLEARPFAGGGEGDVFRIKAPDHLRDHCVKIYRSQANAYRQSKILFMKENPPPNLETNSYQICWVKDAVYTSADRQFAGFIMPLAFNGSAELYELCNSDHSLNNKWEKFGRQNPDGVLRRFKLCVNLAIALHCIHRLKNYVLVDLKPQNILVTPDGRVSLIDMDSIQISQGAKLLFNGRVATPEYTPPEGFLQVRPGVDLVSESWDRFSMAVIFYQILFGIHPYAGTSKEEYQETSSTLAQKIQHGFFPLGTNADKMQVIPPPHYNFHKIPPSIRSLFLECFDKGHRMPLQRPTAERWGQYFYQEITTGAPFQPHQDFGRRPAPKAAPSGRTHIPIPNTQQAAPAKKTSSTATFFIVLIIILFLLSLILGG